MTDTTEQVTVRSIEEIAGVVPDTLIERLLEVCQPGKQGLYSRVAPVVQDIVAEGWSAGSIIQQVDISLYRPTDAVT
jgi:replication factor C subunit 2/4